MDGGVEQPLPPALGALAVAGILWNIGDQARIEDALPIAGGIKTALEVEVGVTDCNRNWSGLQSTEIWDRIICIYLSLQDGILCN